MHVVLPGRSLHRARHERQRAFLRSWILCRVGYLRRHLFHHAKQEDRQDGVCYDATPGQRELIAFAEIVIYPKTATTLGGRLRFPDVVSACRGGAMPLTFE